MYAVIFEVEVNEAHKQDYLETAAKLRTQAEQAKGFISIERFESLVNEGKLLSLSFWETEADILAWKQNVDHTAAQKRGRETYFKDYRIRIANVERDYNMSNSHFS
ncbi:antibiotic biosynthesis monooxygenase [Candidatus Albibeggiatoa sp. nov. NOAA]|uniref:antibiotic biosynthesis monooxygenase family protein n=1 Tax=Candidatus Albibeggiatoa sp. nov. NOAA TaxID=3162724 RepID=UPI0032F60579|nr:antibiotic biosynthesis monooxygenase [Thiotrichaceae bacterium]